MRPSAISSSVLPPAWQLLVIFLAFVPAGRAVIANCTSGWEWSYNSKGQNPCEVVGALQAACEYGGFELGPLGPGSCYPKPGRGDVKALKCGCNTVIYSLYSACAACQNASMGTWAGWRENCGSVSVGQYPFNIPAGIAVPGWSFIDVTGAGNFSATAAMNAGRDPEVIGRVPVTSFISTSSTQSPSSTSDLSPVSTTSDPGGPSDNFDPPPTDEGGGFGRPASDFDDLPSIIGGVLGGLVGLSILLLLVWLSIRPPSHKDLPHPAPHPLSHHAPFTRSHFPHSVSVYSPEPEMGECGGQTPGIQGRLDATSREIPPAYDVRSIMSSEFEVETTHLSVLYESERGYNNQTEF